MTDDFPAPSGLTPIDGRHRLRTVWNVARLLLLELYRRRDVYVALILAVLVVVPLASVNIFGTEGVVRYLSELSLVLIWVVSVVVGISMASRQVPRELETRTVLPLLAKPVRRSDVLVGKFLGAGMATASAVLLFYLFFVGLALLKGLALGPTFLQGVFMHVVFCFFLSSVAMLFSVLFTASATVTLASVLTIGMLVFGARLPHLAEQSGGAAAWALRAVHLLAPHFEFFDLRMRIVHGWPPAEWWAAGLAVLYAIVYSALALTVACAVFRRKAL